MRRLAALLACLALTACTPKEPLAPMPTPRIYASVEDAVNAVPSGLFISKVRGTGSMEEFGHWRGYDTIVGVVGYEFAAYESLKLGELVLRMNPGDTDMVMHRIIARFPGGFALRGTANASRDADLLTPQNFMGRVVWIGVVE